MLTFITHNWMALLGVTAIVGVILALGLVPEQPQDPEEYPWP